jgi:hypothetical protein
MSPLRYAREWARSEGNLREACLLSPLVCDSNYNLLEFAAAYSWHKGSNFQRDDMAHGGNRPESQHAPSHLMDFGILF